MAFMRLTEVFAPRSIYDAERDMSGKDEKAQGEPKKELKPCCACPETKRARDMW